jgi:hypothetical protein
MGNSITTTHDGLAMKASANVTFAFVIQGSPRLTVEVPFNLDMGALLRDPEEYGNLIRTAYYAARHQAAETAKEYFS